MQEEENFYNELDINYSQNVKKPNFLITHMASICIIILFGIFILIVVGVGFGLAINYLYPTRQTKNVILMVFFLFYFKIPDGYGPPIQTLVRVCSGKDALFIDSFLTGTAKTYSSNSWVTDSAAGATAVKLFNNL
jgi:alkaline phosphatase